MQPNRDNHYLADIPPFFIFLSFAIGGWPIGLLLIFLKYAGKHGRERDRLERMEQQRPKTPQSDLGRNANPYSATNSTYGYRPAMQPQPQPATPRKPGEEKDRPTQEMASAQKRQQILTAVFAVLGVVFAIAGASNLSDGLYWVGSELFRFSEDILPGLTQLLGGIGMFVSSIAMKRARRLEQLIDRFVGGKDNISVDEISAAIGVSKKRGRKLVQAAIDHGYFDADSYIDNRTGMLVVRGEAPTPIIPTPAEEPISKADPAADHEDEYQKLLRQLETVNAAIPGDEMTAKISRLEEISTNIFALAKKNPAKRPQLNKFMDYYLPTALKLLNTYADLDKQTVQGKNIAETRASIEHAMDLLVTAFERQLDKLYETDAMDVTSDVAALQGMLTMDGLAPQNGFDAMEVPQAPVLRPDN